MEQECEAFYAGDGNKVGAILRAAEADTLRTRTVFGADDSLYLIDQVTRHGGDVRDWTTFHFTDHGQNATVHGERTTEQIVIDGRPTTVPHRAVPSHLTRLIVADALTDPDLEFVQFTEHGISVDTTTVQLGRDQIRTPWEEQHDCRTVQLIKSGSPGILFAFAEPEDETETPELIMSDWGGARSYPVTDLDTLIDGLGDEVVVLIMDFFDR